MGCLLWFGPSDANKVVLFVDFRRSRISSHYILVSTFHSNDMAESAQTLDVITLHNLLVIVKLILLSIRSNAEIIANSRWIEDFT